MWSYEEGRYNEQVTQTTECTDERVQNDYLASTSMPPVETVLKFYYYIYRIYIFYGEKYFE